MGSHPGKWWHRLEDGRLQCDLCPRECKLNVGQRGFCFVRAREGDQLVLETYGRSSGFCVDPIEKKPLAHFYPGTSVLSFGTAGCNLGCRFCQNWDISKATRSDRLAEEASPEAIATRAKQLGCKSVAFTYNDQTIFAEYAIDVALACREAGIKTVAVTAGYIRAQPRAELFSVMDAANVDLKAFTEDFYRRLTFARLQPVLETLEYLVKEAKVWTELTTLIIPGHNDSERGGGSSQVGGETLGPTCRSTSRPSTPTFACSTSRPRRRRRSAGRAGSRCARACATSTPATCTTPRVTPRTARAAPRRSSSATGIGCSSIPSPKTADAPTVPRRWPATLRPSPARGGAAARSPLFRVLRQRVSNSIPDRRASVAASAYRLRRRADPKSRAADCGTSRARALTGAAAGGRCPRAAARSRSSLARGSARLR